MSKKLGIDSLFDQIDELEKKIRKKHPKQKGRVIIANAKQKADYEVGKEDIMRWAHTYFTQLEKSL